MEGRGTGSESRVIVGAPSRGAVVVLAAILAFAVAVIAPSAAFAAPPVTTINNADLDAYIKDTTPRFRFSADQSPVTFECQVDTGGFAGCSGATQHVISPALTDGPHSFDVQATNTVPETGAAASHSFLIDSTDPVAQFDTPPPAAFNTSDPTFTFSASDPAPTGAGDAGPASGLFDFQCRFELAGGWSTCASPYTWTGLSDGPHTFQVRARDNALNLHVLRHDFVVDTGEPDTTITGGPSGLTNDPTPEFQFTGSDPAPSSGIAGFDCQVDTGGWLPCSSPEVTASLGDGPHTFYVRARDGAGNVDGTPDSRSFTVDATPPETTIDSPNPGATTDTTPTFSFSSNEAGSTFECQVDSGGWTPGCTSPYTSAVLADGPHTFEVRATDPAANVDGSPASQTFFVDTVRPNTTITVEPPSKFINDNTPTFEFTASDPAPSSGIAGFECRIDTGPWDPCVSAHTTATLADGVHTFRVRAVDNAGNIDNSPDSFTNFTVDTGLPDTTITANPPQYSNDTNPTFEFTGSDPSPSSGIDHFECRLDGSGPGGWNTCSSGDSFSTPEGNHTFEVRAVDKSGNADPSPATYSWMVDTTKPTIDVTHPEIKEHFLLHEGELDYSCDDPLGGGVASGVDTCTDSGFDDDIPLGPRLITFEATDRAGNSADPITRAYVIDPPDYGKFVKDSDPLAYYRMDEAIGSDEMKDRSGNGRNGAYQYGIALGRDAATNCERRPHPPRACELANPARNNAAFFPARDGHGYVNGISAPKDAYTMEAWVKPADSNNMMIMGHGGGGQLFISGGKLAFRQVQDTITGGGPTLAPGKWWHVAATWDGDETRLYVNGNQVGFSDSANKEPSGTSTFFVGYGEMAPWFHGDIDEAAYYDHALDRHAFQDRYAIGTVKDKKSLGVGDLNTAGPATDPEAPKNGGLYANSGTTPKVPKADFDCTDPDDVSGDSDIASCTATVSDGSSTQAIASGDQLPNAVGDYTFVVTATDEHGNTYVHTHSYSVKEFSSLYGFDKPIAYYRLGDGSGQPMKDSSTHHRDGEYKNDQDSGPVGIAGDGNKARDFFGAGGYGYVNGISAPRFQATMAAWVYPRDGRDQAIMGHGDAGELYIKGGSFWFRHMDVQLDSGVAPKLNKWQQVVGVWDGVEIKIYVNGKLKAATEATKRPSSVSTFYVGFGELAPWFFGAIDEVVYYDKALDANRVYQLWLADPPPVELSAAGGDDGGSGGGGDPGPGSEPGDEGGGTDPDSGDPGDDPGGPDSPAGDGPGGGDGDGDGGDGDAGDGDPGADGGELAEMSAEFVGKPKLKGKKLVAKVACGTERDCTGTATGKLKLRKKSLRIGTKSLDLDAGATKRITFKLNRKQRRKLAKGKVKAAKVVLEADGGRRLATGSSKR